ncbi:MAG TPA: two-component regulator propeller domain-containing protein [Bacteroidales bacterium]|nr:two-component regulator propeller domain-containing protein [Bacteroidales bacterium]
MVQMKHRKLCRLSLMKFLTIFWLWFFLGQGSRTVFSQDFPDLDFKHITYHDGLGGNQVFSIIKDARGFMWFGTENSLARFDGQTLRTYHYDINDSTSLKGNAIGALLVDRQNQLLIGTDLGLVRYDRNCDRYIAIPESGVSLKRRNVIDLDMSADGTVLVTYLYHILRLDTGKGMMTPLLNLPEEKGLYAEDDYLCQTVVSGSDQLLVFSFRKVVQIDLMKHVSAQTDHPCGLIHSVRPVHDGRYLVSGSNGLFLFNQKDFSMLPFSRYSGFKEFDHLEFWDAFEDPWGNIWAATDHNGILVYKPGRERLISIKADPYNDNTINDGFVRKFYLDRENILWIGCYRHGVNYTSLHPSKKFVIYEHIPGNSLSLSSNSVLSLLEDKRGNVWVGTDGGGLDCISASGDEIRHFRYTGKPGIPSDAILALMEDRAGKIWVGGYMGQVALYDPDRNTWKMLTPECPFPGCSGKHDIRQIVEDSQGKVWLVTNGHGLFRFDPVKGKWDSYNTLNSDLVDNYALTILEDNNYRFWVGTYNGACLLDPETRKGRSFIYTEKRPDGLSHNWVYSLYRDRKNRLWIGTANGLNLFKPADTSFVHITISNGLPGNVINAITEDRRGNLWISTNNGLCRFIPDSSSFWNLYEDDGLPGNYFSRGACFQSKAGVLMFGSDQGMVRFDPDDIRPDTTIYPVYIKDVLVNYRSILNQATCSAEPQAGLPVVVLPYGKKSVTFQYGALNYLNQKNNRFEYILEGYEDNWISTGTRREVTFTGLEPGTYTFRVRGCNNDGYWDKKGDSLKIIVLTPWYRTWFFRVILVLVIIAIILGYVYLRNQSILRRNRLLEQQVHERTHELEVANEELLANAEALDHTVKELESQKTLLQQQTEELRATNDRLHELNRMNDRIFSIIAHDIKNPLGTIQGFIELLTLHHKNIDEKKKEEYLEYIRQSIQKLLSLIENLLLWSSSQLKGRGAHPEPFDLAEPVQENIHLVKEQAAKKNITLHFSTEGKYPVFADKYMISAVVRNLLSNAVKFCRQGGEVSVGLQKKDGFVVCSVSDQGAGMDEETKALLFDPDRKKIRAGTGGETGSGLGLLICKEFVEQNHGRIWAESTPGAGTTFFFDLPAEKQESGV